MANYKDIQGFHVQNLTSDPTPYAQALSNDPYGGTWASGSDLSTAREALAGAGTQTASIVAGGSTSPGSYSNAVEYYNGTSWSEQTEINEAREFVTGSGTQTAAIIFAGRDGPNTHPGNVESWDGSS